MFFFFFFFGVCAKMKKNVAYQKLKVYCVIKTRQWRFRKTENRRIRERRVSIRRKRPNYLSQIKKKKGKRGCSIENRAMSRNIAQYLNSSY